MNDTPFKNPSEFNYEEVVFKKLLGRLYEMPKEVREMYWNNIRGKDRIYQYLYILSQLPVPMYYFTLGIISFEQADEMSRIGMEVFMNRVKNKVEKAVNPDELDPYQYQIYRRLLLEIEEKTYCVDALGSLLDLGVSDTEVKELYPTVKEIITEMMNRDFDRYLPLALRFKPDYFEAVENFRNLCELIVETEQEVCHVDFQDVLHVSPCVVKGNKHETMIRRLELISDVLSFVSQRNELTEQFVKTKGYWKQIMDYNCRRSLKELANLPQNERYPEINIRLKRMSSVLEEFFPRKIAAKEASVLMSYLIINGRRILLEASQTEEDKLYRSLWYNKSIGFTAAMEKTVEKNPSYDIDLSGLSCLFQLLQQKKSSPEFGENQESLKSEQVQPYEIALVHFNYLKRLYYAKKEQSIPEINKAIFGAMRDYEILYLMGVLSKQDYQWCCHAKEMIQYNEEERAIKEASIKEIFISLMDQKPGVILPLKKEHIDVMEQIRLAGSLYERAYMDDCLMTRIDLSYPNPFSNICDFNQSPLRSEGLMLEDLILLMHDISQEPLETNQVLRGILNSYWQETVSALHDLPIYPGKEAGDMSLRIEENKQLFDIKSSDVAESVNNRLVSYKQLFYDIRHDILVKYESNPSLRLVALNRFEAYVHPFEEMGKHFARRHQNKVILKKGNNQNSKDN